MAWARRLITTASVNSAECAAASKRLGAPQAADRDKLLARLGAGGLADMNGASVGTLELDRDPVLAIELTADAVPAEVYSARLQLQANGVHHMIGEYGDE